MVASGALIPASRLEATTLAFKEAMYCGTVPCGSLIRDVALKTKRVRPLDQQEWKALEPAAEGAQGNQAVNGTQDGLTDDDVMGYE